MQTDVRGRGMAICPRYGDMPLRKSGRDGVNVVPPETRPRDSDNREAELQVRWFRLELA